MCHEGNESGVGLPPDGKHDNLIIIDAKVLLVALANPVSLVMADLTRAVALGSIIRASFVELMSSADGGAPQKVEVGLLTTYRALCRMIEPSESRS